MVRNFDLTDVAHPRINGDRLPGFSVAPPSKRHPAGHQYSDFAQQCFPPGKLRHSGLPRPYSTGDLRHIGAVTIAPDAWPQRCPQPPDPAKVKDARLLGQVSSPLANSPDFGPRCSSAPDDSAAPVVRTGMWRRVSANFNIIGGMRDNIRNPRTYSPAYYAYHVNQRPVPWMFRGHRFHMMGAERTGDLHKEERFEERAI
jgi:hypothetical protein